VAMLVGGGCLQVDMETAISRRISCQRSILLRAAAEYAHLLAPREDARILVPASADIHAWQVTKAPGGDSNALLFSKCMWGPGGMVDRLIRRYFGDVVEVVQAESLSLDKGDEVRFALQRKLLSTTYDYAEFVRLRPTPQLLRHASPEDLEQTRISLRARLSMPGQVAETEPAAHTQGGTAEWELDIPARAEPTVLTLRAATFERHAWRLGVLVLLGGVLLGSLLWGVTEPTGGGEEQSDDA